MSIFPDHFAGRTGAVTALAGVLGRRLHGDSGFHVEVCQVEQVVNVMADLLAKESLEPGSVQPRGNHSDRGTPWGLFPCKDDDSWVVICTRTDAEWRAFAEVMGSPEWAMTDEFAVLRPTSSRGRNRRAHRGLDTATPSPRSSRPVSRGCRRGRCTTPPDSTATRTTGPVASSSNSTNHRSAA